jgi:glycolate oxidase subunit GlcD
MVDWQALQVPDGEVLFDETTRREYGSNDWTQELTEVVLPDAVVFAESIADVQAAVKFAHNHDVAVVPQGAKTSISNGSAGLVGSLILNVSRMDHILELKAADQIAVVEPGVINGELDRAAREVGYFYAPDPGSKQLSSIGGNVATNAGGMASLKYGTTKQSVLGVKVVLADGRLVSFGGRTFKNNAAYDFTSLFVGSEGTLGVIVEVTVRLLPVPLGNPVTGLATFATIHDLATSVQRMQATGVYPSMLEVLNGVSIRAIDDYQGTDFSANGEQAMLIFQLDTAVAGALELTEKTLQEAGASALTITDDPDRTAEIIKIRQEIFQAGAQYGRLIVEDVAVPLGKLAEVADEAERIANKFGQRLFLGGHAGDGNLHPDLILVGEDGPLPDSTLAAIDELLPYVISMGGTVSAEHGIGELKRRWVSQQLSDDVRQLQRDVKAVFDPKGIMNPGRKI